MAMTDQTKYALWSETELADRLRQLEDEAAAIKEELRVREQRRRSQEEADCGLTLKEISRYSRQLLLPELSVTSQVRLKSSKGVLIVGAGGLGCPAAMYLAAAGVGRIGIVDHDVVDLSNLNRQVLHTEESVNVMPKAVSVQKYLSSLNSSIVCEAHVVAISSVNALELVGSYDVVLDASDNVATRYLLNDACVIAGKPLVSGSALRLEGQLTVYNHPPGVGPTYRCLFPTPPPPSSVTNCSDGGILGAVTGVIGCLQAIEAVKVIVSVPEMETLAGKLLIFDASNGRFRCVKLRPRRPDAAFPVSLIDYEEFCGAAATDKDNHDPERTVSGIDPANDRMTVREYKQMYLDAGRSHLLLDVRTRPEMEICRLPKAVNVPLEELDRSQDQIREALESVQPTASGGKKNEPGKRSLVVCCRRGNDSQMAVIKLRDTLARDNVEVRDIVGGLNSWGRTVNRKFPVY